MVFVKALGFLDLVAAVVIILGQAGIVHWRPLIIAGAYLLVKGILYFKDVASKIDVVIGAYCVILVFKPFLIVTIISALYLTVKAFFSFAA